jgi:CubicO group peptidase (beta-lactamase class C family)
MLSLASISLLWALSGSATFSRPADAQIIQDLKERLEELARKDQFSGTVLLAKNNQILFEQAYGFADHAFEARNRVDTKINLGSMNKMFTAVAILQLMQQGKLSAEDPLIKLLPDYPGKDVAAKVTVQQLLTHTSGIADFFGKEFIDSNPGKYRTLAAYLPLFAEKPLLFEPGSRYRYNNAEYIVLGLIIERLSGESYYDYVREHIFKPAGMINTDSYNVDDDVPNLALGYTRANPGSPPDPAAPRRTNLFMHLSRGVSAGGGYSTVEDLLRFSAAVQGNKLLDAEHTNILMTGKVPTRPGAKYGYGMEEEFLNGVRIVGHNGGGPGISSQLDMYPDLGYTVAVMSNYDGGIFTFLRRLRGELTGQERPPVSHLSAQVLQSFAGTYSVPGRPPLTITAGEEGLWIDIGDGRRHRLWPVSKTEFFDDDDPGIRHRFAKTGKGQMTMSVTGLGPQPLSATRQP